MKEKEYGWCDMLTVREFSEETGLTTRQVYSLIHRNTIRHDKPGTKILIYPGQENVKVRYKEKVKDKKPKLDGYLTMYEASKILGITPQGVAFRIKRGWYKEYTFNGIRHIKQSEIKTAVAKPTEKEVEKQAVKKTLRKCSACGKNTYNRMLCSTCFRNADEEVIY